MSRSEGTIFSLDRLCEQLENLREPQSTQTAKFALHEVQETARRVLPDLFPVYGLRPSRRRHLPVTASGMIARVLNCRMQQVSTVSLADPIPAPKWAHRMPQPHDLESLVCNTEGAQEHLQQFATRLRLENDPTLARLADRSLDRIASIDALLQLNGLPVAAKRATGHLPAVLRDPIAETICSLFRYAFGSAFFISEYASDREERFAHRTYVHCLEMLPTCIPLFCIGLPTGDELDPEEHWLLLTA
ncbi:hypothetical protein HY632_03725 [Candidatus Uhrbacteria bacterium]|nr:hypothetical protein [Candidatus Uhrbacteria bacterium]